MTVRADLSVMGIFGALGTLPFLLFGLLVGVHADRSRRRPIMNVTDVGQAMSLATVSTSLLEQFSASEGFEQEEDAKHEEYKRCSNSDVACGYVAGDDFSKDYTESCQQGE